jgi:hypothetical protein
VKPYHFTAQAFQDLVIWGDSEEAAAELIDEAIDDSKWDMTGADWEGEIPPEEIPSYVSHGAIEYK